MNQSTHEASYAGYSRVPVPRNTDAWSVINGLATNAYKISFPHNQGDLQQVTHIGVGQLEEGTGALIAVQALTGGTTDVPTSGRPQLDPGTLTVELTGELTDPLATELLKLILQNVAATSIGDAGGIPAAGTGGNIWLSLHVADPLS